MRNAFSAEGMITCCVDRVNQCNAADRTNEVLVDSANVYESPEVDAVRDAEG